MLLDVTFIQINFSTINDIYRLQLYKNYLLFNYFNSFNILINSHTHNAIKQHNTIREAQLLVQMPAVRVRRLVQVLWGNCPTFTKQKRGAC